MGSQQAALRNIVVLVLVAGLAGCVPGRNGTEERLEALLSRSLLHMSVEKRQEISRDRDYLLGIKRLRRLYCNVGIGFHIQVLPDGRITGVHNENRQSKLCHTFTHRRLAFALKETRACVRSHAEKNIVRFKRLTAEISCGGTERVREAPPGSLTQQLHGR